MHFKLTGNKIAALIFLLIAAIYLHPAFFGKVNSPIDIRDVNSYPWRQHVVNNKVKPQAKILIAIKSAKKVNKNNNDITYALEAPPNQEVKYPVEFKFDKEDSPDLTNLKTSNYYITTNLYATKEQATNAYFRFYLVDKITGHEEPLKVASVTGVKGKPNASHVYWKLNYVLKKVNPDLKKSYILVINKSNKNATLYLSEPIFKIEDYSNAPIIHSAVIDDLIKWFTPAREYYSNSLKQFKLPFWTHDILTGTEFLAEPQVGFLHPVYLIIYFLFDHFTAHIIMLFLALFLCGFGAYLFAKYLGLNNAVAIFTGIVYMFHPTNATWFGFEHTPMCSAVLPFLLLSYCKNLQSPKLLNGYLLISSLLMGTLYLSGHLQLVYYTLIFFGIFALFVLLINLLQKKNIIKHIFSLVFIVAIGLMIGSVVLVPFFSLLENSHRLPLPKSTIMESAVSFPALVSLVNPFYRGYPSWEHFERPILPWSIFLNYTYFGIIPLVLSFLSLKYMKKQKFVVLCLICITFSILVCTASPIFFLIKDYIPGFSKMLGARFLHVYSLSIPFLAGFGFNYLHQNFIVKHKFRKLIIVCIMIITSVDLMYHASHFITWSDPKNYKPVHKNGALEFLINKHKNSSEPFRVLALANTRLPGLILEDEIAAPNTLQPYGLEDASGYSSFVSKDIYNLFVYSNKQDSSILYSNEYIRAFDNPNIPYPIYNYKSKILDLFNIKYFLSPNFFNKEDFKNFRRVFHGDATIYENLDALPRAFVVSHHKIIKDPKETIIYLDSEEFNPRKTVVLDHGQRTADNRPQITDNRQQTADNNGQEIRDKRQQMTDVSSPMSVVSGLMSVVTFTNYEPENIKLKVQTNSAGFLVLGHNLNKNWKVKVNGKEKELLKANLIQSAIHLSEAGTYQVEYYYTPILLLLGEAITISGLLLLLGLGILIYKRDLKLNKK